MITITRLNIFLILLILTSILTLLEQGEISQESLRNIPNHIILALILEFSATLLEFQKDYLKYRRPELLFKIYDGIYLTWITLKIKWSLTKENQRTYNEQLIALALNNLVTGKKRQKKINALAQLYEFGKNSGEKCKRHIYESLVEAHYKESDKAIKKILIEAICHFHNICN